MLCCIVDTDTKNETIILESVVILDVSEQAA